MKKSIKNLILSPVLIACLSLLMASPVTAQTFKTLHSFNPASLLDGAYPWSGLILSGNTLYGTTMLGGRGDGILFALNTDGSGFTNLFNFGANVDGFEPRWMVLSSSTLYGTTMFDTSGTDGGTVFTINTDGSGFTPLYNFGGSDGSYPYGGLTLSGSTLYGTTSKGGDSGSGTVFAIDTDWTDSTILYSFTAISGGPLGAGTNSDGACSCATMAVSGNTLYGTTQDGGSSGMGTVFAINTDGTGFTNLYSFAGDGDAAYPEGALIVSGNTLYGTTGGGSTTGGGTVFAINTDGTSFRTLHSFAALTNYASLGNSEGANPAGPLILSGNTLYGTASDGGRWNSGTVFAINTDGTGFSNLYTFTATSRPLNTNPDGANPRAGLILSGNTLYGTATRGGSSGNGTVFSLTLPPPQLTLTPSGPNIILTWPTNATGFTLQSTSNLGSAAVWTTNTPAPVVVNDQNVVTNPISGTQMFFRLSQ